MERSRDPSHTCALQRVESCTGYSPGWQNVLGWLFYKYPVDVDDLLSRAFPDPGGEDSFRRMVDADVGVNRLGIDASREGGLRFAFPVVILSGVKA